jgi:hypothetical protein
MPRENTYYTQELHGPFETYISPSRCYRLIDKLCNQGLRSLSTGIERGAIDARLQQKG